MSKLTHTRRLLSLFLLFLLWYLFAMQMNNDFIMPSPMQVIIRMASLITSETFYISVLATIVRVVLGLCVAFISALVMALASYRYAFFKDISYPLLLLARSVPNVCYIIIVQLWFGRELSSGIITFLILFPVIYANIYEGLCHLPNSLLNVLKIYPEHFTYTIGHIYLPMMKAAMVSSFSSGLSLGFKVGVMSEILGQIQIGIGRQLNICRLSFDMTGVFAWTGWIVVLLFLFELVFYMVQRTSKDVS